MQAASPLQNIPTFNLLLRSLPVYLSQCKRKEKSAGRDSGSPSVQASIPIQHTYWVSFCQDRYNRLMTLVLKFSVTHLSSAPLHCLRVSIMSDSIIHQFIPIIPHIQFSEQVRQIIPFPVIALLLTHMALWLKPRILKGGQVSKCFASAPSLHI